MGCQMMRRLGDLAAVIGAENRCLKAVPAGAGPVPGSGGREKLSICVIGAGDVGVNAALGLRLLGGDVLERIGIFDPDEKRSARAEMEIGQVWRPDVPEMPGVHSVTDMDGIFGHDVILFTASKGVPALGTDVGDVRLAQLKANAELVKIYGKEAKARGYQGLFFIMSDPVDDLCNVMLRYSGMPPERIRGFGLGVMNARARYYAERDERFSEYLTKGRAFGQHGDGLVLAVDPENYDDSLSKELTGLAAKANLRVRDLGFKPYIAPAFSSGAVSVLETLRGGWNYGSVYIGDPEKGSFFGALSRLGPEGAECEDVRLPEALFGRLEESFRSLYERDEDL